MGPAAKPLTVFGAHKEKWKNGCGSELCPKANKICFARGKIPADIVILGQAPGKTENLFGEPFTGPAGILLDRIISHSIPDHLRVAFTNLVGCFPLDEETGKDAEPDEDSICKCSYRLYEFIEICDPTLIITAGNLARDWTKKGFRDTISFHNPDIQFVHITHPSAILKGPIATKEFQVQRAIATIATAIEELSP